MSLHFTPTRIRFLENLRSVRVTAESNGVPSGVLIPRDVIEHLAAAQKLSRDESITVIVRHKKQLEIAANRAFRRSGSGSTAITVEMADVEANTPTGA